MAQMAIAPEDLVSARSRQDGGHALTPGSGGDDVGIDAVHGRLVHRPEEAGDGVEESPRIQQDLDVEFRLGIGLEFTPVMLRHFKRHEPAK